MMTIRTQQTCNHNVPTEYYANKIEFTMDGKVIFWDEELQYWIILEPAEVISIIG